jgi:hypothetical protein
MAQQLVCDFAIVAVTTSSIANKIFFMFVFGLYKSKLAKS